MFPNYLSLTKLILDETGIAVSLAHASGSPYDFSATYSTTDVAKGNQVVALLNRFKPAGRSYNVVNQSISYASTWGNYVEDKVNIITLSIVVVPAMPLGVIYNGPYYTLESKYATPNLYVSIVYKSLTGEWDNYYKNYDSATPTLFDSNFIAMWDFDSATPLQQFYAEAQDGTKYETRFIDLNKESDTIRQRATTLSVTKTVGANATTTTYHIASAFVNYEELTADELASIPIAEYNTRIAAFIDYVEGLELGLTVQNTSITYQEVV